MNKHEQKIKTLIPIAEAGDSRQAAYRAIAEEIDAWMKEDSTLTVRAIGAQIGKSEKWVSTLSKALLRARNTGGEFVIDWKSGKHSGTPVLERNQVNLARELLERPGIADAVVRSHTPAARAVKQAISKVQYEEMVGATAARERRRHDEAMPISGHLARIAGKINTYTSNLVAIKDDLVEAEQTPGTRMVAIALRALADECLEIANAIDPDLRNLNVIEAGDRR